MMFIGNLVQTCCDKSQTMKHLLISSSIWTVFELHTSSDSIHLQFFEPHLVFTHWNNLCFPFLVPCCHCFVSAIICGASGTLGAKTNSSLVLSNKEYFDTLKVSTFFHTWSLDVTIFLHNVYAGFIAPANAFVALIAKSWQRRASEQLMSELALIGYKGL